MARIVVLTQRLDVIDLHPALQPPNDRRRLIAAEVPPGTRAEPRQNVRHLSLGIGVRRAFFGEHRHVRARAHVAQYRRGQVGGRQDVIDQPRGDGRLRHAVIFGFTWILDERQPAAFSDRLQAERAIRSRLAQNHTDGVAIVCGCERTKKVIDGCPLTALRFQVGKAQVRVDRGEVAARRNHINMIRLHRNRLVDLRYRNLDERLQEPGEMAFVLSGEVNDHHEGDARIRRHVLKERF